jgi:PilZ domain
VGRENRTGKRFPVHLPVKVHQSEVKDEHAGVTGNVSAAGVYIQADAALEVGSHVEFEITLPPDVTGGDSDVVIQGRGRVVRSDDAPTGADGDNNSKGVACVIDHYEFVRNS